jgi:RNA polymerase sigma-70 factor, ECF subfamily
VDTQRIDFEEWYRTSHPRLVASLLLVTGDLDLTRDAVDEAFARAYARWERVRRMDSPAGWTYRVALNVVRRRQRRRGLERRLLRRELPPAAMPAPAGEAWALVGDLPERQRTAVVLRYVADLTQEQIAEAMGVTRGTVASTLADAHRRLEVLLAEPGGAPPAAMKPTAVKEAEGA